MRNRNFIGSHSELLPTSSTLSVDFADDPNRQGSRSMDKDLLISRRRHRLQHPRKPTPSPGASSTGGKRLSFWGGGAERISGRLRHEVTGRCYVSETLLHCDQPGCDFCNEDCPVARAMKTWQPVEGPSVSCIPKPEMKFPSAFTPFPFTTSTAPSSARSKRLRNSRPPPMFAIATLDRSIKEATTKMTKPAAGEQKPEPIKTRQPRNNPLQKKRE